MALDFELGFRLRTALMASSALLALPGVAQAQDTDTSEDEAVAVGSADTADEGAPIIVTGTLIRGIAPVGTSVVGITAEDVAESGAKSPIELLADVPEISNFFNQVNVPSTNFGSPANRPAIRGLPTLVMLNGYRLVGTGLIQTAPEPNQIAPGSIGRVEVIPGSGSSIYGSDAIGGVVNFITRRDFDGIEMSGRYGIGDDFTTVDGQVTIGQSWDSGSAFISYAYAHHGNVHYSDRDYYSLDLRPFGGDDFRTKDCPGGTITVDGVDYLASNGRPGTNFCDRNLNADFYPEETRHNVFAGFEQDLSPSLRFNATGYFSRRETTIQTATASTTSQTITDANPFFRPVGSETSHTIAFAYDPVFGPSQDNQGKFDSYGITAELTADVFADWQVKLGGNYGHSDNFNSAYEINAVAQAAAINGTTLDTALNPYDLSQTNPAVLDAIANSRTVAETTQNLYQARLVADGTLFEFSGNAAKLAVGVEYLENDVSPTLKQGPIPGFVTTTSSGSENVKSVFGELVVPLVGPQNDIGGIYELTVSASGRYDEYSNWGGTFNPKFALTWAPVDGLRFIANWGENFNAPALTDTTVTVDTRNQFIGASPFQRPTDDFLANIGRPTILIAGGNPNLTPQTSKSWSVGFEYEPDFAPGLKISTDYYNIKFRNKIFLVLPFPASNITNPALASYFNWNPTLEEARALLSGRRNDGFVDVDALYAGDPSTYPFLILDARRDNLGAENHQGIDARINYRGDIGAVTVTGGLNLTYEFKNEAQQVPGTPFINQLDNGTRSLLLTANAGIEYKALTAQLTYFRNGSYPVDGIPGQDRVGAFGTTNLFLSYDLGAHGLDNTKMTLNVDNLFNNIPPFINSGQGRANGSTLGTVVTMGVSTKF